MCRTEKMDRIGELRSCFTYFYIFGQTTYVPLNGGHFKKLLFLSFFPKLIQFLMISGTIFSCITQNYEWPHFKDYTFVVLFAMLLLNCISNSLAFYYNLTSPFSSHNICKIFAEVIQYTEQKLFITIPISRFQRCFHKKILIGILIEMFVSFIRLIVPSYFLKPITYVMYLIAFVYRTVLVLHMVMFIKLIQVVLHSVNTKLSSVIPMRRSAKRSLVLCTFQQIKWIHFKLWKISKMINSQFGSIFICLSIEFCAYATVSIYYAFVYIQTLQPTHLLLRNLFNYL